MKLVIGDLNTVFRVPENPGPVDQNSQLPGLIRFRREDGTAIDFTSDVITETERDEIQAALESGVGFVNERNASKGAA